MILHTSWKGCPDLETSRTFVFSYLSKVNFYFITPVLELPAISLVTLLSELV